MEVIVIRDSATKVPVDVSNLDEEGAKQAVLALVSQHGPQNVLVDGKSFAEATEEAAGAADAAGPEPAASAEEKPGGLYEAGDNVPTAGTWELRGPRGGHTGSYVYLTVGEQFPPVPEDGQQYTLKEAAV